MGGGGGLGTFSGGSVGGVSNPALGQPQSPPLNPMNLPAGSAGPMAGMNAPSPTLTQQQSAVDKFRGGAQKVANLAQAWQDAGQNLQGGPFGQRTGGTTQPVNFAVMQQPFIPAPTTLSSGFGQNNPYAMSNAFYGG